MKRATIMAAALVVSVAPALAAPLSYTVTKTVPLGSPDRWDYVVFEPTDGRVYIGHSTETTIVDGQSGAVVGHFMGLKGAHGTAIVPKLGRGFADSGQAPSVTAFDLKSFEKLPSGEIATPADTDGMLYDPASGHVFTMNGDSGNASVIDPAKIALLTNIPLGGKPEYAAADGQGHVYANIEDKGQIAAIDSMKNVVTAHWALPGCVSPHGLAVDPVARRIFSSCANGKLVVMNADTGEIVATLPIGLGSDAVAFDPVRKRIFSSNGSGSLSVILENSPDSFAAPVDIKTTRGARTMAVDPKSGRVFLVAADFTENMQAAPTARNRFVAAPGSARLMFLDPAD